MSHDYTSIEDLLLATLDAVSRFRVGQRGLRVLRAAGEPVISEYSISHRTLRPSAYTPKRWVGQESRED